MKNYPLYEHERLSNLKELLLFCEENYGNRPAFQYSDKKETVTVDYIQFKAEVEALGTSLFDLGLLDCHIAVYGENSYEWILTYFAVTCGKNVIIPIDKELEAEQIAQLLQDSQCKAIIYSDTYSDVAGKLQSMELGLRFINMKQLAELLERGNVLLESGNRQYLDVTISANDLASIVYTSGTTGRSKGVMLTHLNFCACVYGACCNIRVPGTALLVLPLHHTFGLTAGVLSVMMYGKMIYINKSLKKIAVDMKIAKPQLILVVPMILDSFYKSIWNTAKKQGKDKALKILIKISDVLLILGIDIRKKFFSTVLDSLGGNLNLVISGGASLDEKQVKAFHSLGITVLNGYGITECGPIVATNRNDFAVPESVGVPVCCNEVKISDEGEILVKGDNVMAGYYHNESENEKVFLDGWFRTGDLGYLDKYGALHITGRSKNLIILSNGENIPAESIENMVLSIPYVKEVVAYGKNDRIAVEVFLDEEVTDAKQRIHEDIKLLNKKLPPVKNIGDVIIRDTEFPKTTTKKIKRNYGGDKC